MSRLRYWKIFTCLLALALVSSLAGALVGHHLTRREMERRRNLENWNEHVAREFDRVVRPNPDQSARIQAHLDQAVRELQAIRLETIARSTNVIWRLVTQVQAELTPEQRQAFQTMIPRPGDLTLDVLKVKAQP